MRILFWGTPDFAVPSLRALGDEGFDVIGVVTRPDRPAGRGRKLTPAPVKRVAVESSLPVFTPDRPSDPGFADTIREIRPDLSVVVAYGHILKPHILEIPHLGSINVHASLLPELRGAAPINWAIARGHAVTGVTIMRMVEAMDAGAIIHQVREPILADETAGELTLRLSELGAEALVEALTLMSAGAAKEVAQNHAAATYAPKVDRETGHIEWTRSADEIAALVRAVDPVPGAWSRLDGAPVKVFRPAVWTARDLEGLSPEGSHTNGGPRVRGGRVEPGEVLAADLELGVLVQTGRGGVAFHEVQPPGKRRMDAADWIHGRGVEVGQRFQ